MTSILDVFFSAFAHFARFSVSWVLDSACALPFTFYLANLLPSLIFSPLSFIYILNVLFPFFFDN
jgi:hypothetical protein